MKIPWRKNSKSCSPTTGTSATKVVVVDHPSTSYNIENSVCSVVENYDGGVDVAMMKMTMVNSNNGRSTRVTTATATTTTTTPKKPTVRCNGDGISNITNTTPVTSSPTLLGSGHYSPVDGSVQTFAPAISTTNDDDDDVVSTTTTTATLLLDQTSVFIQPTSLIFDHQRSDDDYDVYLTPLQSSIASIDESNTSSHENVHKTIPLTVAESTLTDITTDATVDGEDTKDDILRIGDSDDSPTTYVVPPPPSSSSSSSTTPTVTKDVISETLPIPKSPKFLRHASSFLRVSDLIGMDPAMDFSEHSHKSIPNYHCCSDTPPPGIPHDRMEQWVALDDGVCRRGNDDDDDDDDTEVIMSSYTPIAQFAVDALATTALATIFDATMWVPDSRTAKIIESKPVTSWEASTFQQNPPPNNASTTTQLEDHILIWSGTFRHGLYGSEIPAIRSAAVIYMSATKLLHLLMDSNRVKEYNTMSLGRTDLLTLPCRHIVTKVMRSESRPPLLRKTLQFTSIFHARKLNVDEDYNNNNDSTNLENDSYLLVTRAVENPTTNTNNTGSETNGTNNNNNVVVSEILLGVNVIRSIPHQPNACVLLSVNHVRSPMVPSLFLAKRLGLQAATNFVHDLRKCC